MVDYLHRPVAHDAFFKKYASKKFLKGKANLHIRYSTSANLPVASIFTRQWAKKYYSLYLDPELPGTETVSRASSHTAKGR